jgi:hypothetical protein
MLDDPWIKANSPMEPESIHALGVISVHWNIWGMSRSLLKLSKRSLRIEIYAA